MSDSIVGCTVWKDAQGKILYYDINFTFDTPVFETWDRVCVMPYDLSNPTDPTDLTEVKTVACKKAKVIKDMCADSVAITDLNGPVSL